MANFSGSPSSNGTTTVPFDDLPPGNLQIELSVTGADGAPVRFEIAEYDGQLLPLVRTNGEAQ